MASYNPKPPHGSSHAPPLPPRLPDMSDIRPDDAPPPVPTTPRPTLYNLKPLQYPSRSEVFTLTELIDAHQSLFPLRVIVVRGHYGDRGEDSAIATDEVYNIHFVKKSKVFTIKDCQGHKYFIPLNSATRFGFPYSKGIVKFVTIEDVLKATPQPLMITATQLYRGTDENNSVHSDEVLIIKGITKASKLKKSKATLDVFSLKTNAMKRLPKDVFGNFTTDPFYNLVYLTDIKRHMPDCLPIKAHLYIDFESEEPLPDYLTSELVTIHDEFIETSLVTSPMLEDEDGSKKYVTLNEKIVDIPVTLPIEVSVLNPDDDNDDEMDYEELYEATRDLITKYNPMLGRTFRETDGDYTYVKESFNAVRKGYESEGLNIQLPQTIDALRPHPPPKHSFKLRNLDSKQPTMQYQSLISAAEDDDSYEDMINNPESSYRHSLSSSVSFDNEIPSAPALPPRTLSSVCSKVPGRRQHLSPPISGDGVFCNPSKLLTRSDSLVLKSIQKELDIVVKRMERIENDRSVADTNAEKIDTLTKLCESLQETNCSLALKVTSLQTDLTSLQEEVECICEEKSTTVSVDNTGTELMALNCTQVIQLLQAMGPSLAKHCETFAKESLDGELLANCTDDVLREDLGISSKLERIKLLQVINGTKSVESVLQGSYVEFQFGQT